MGGVMDSAAKRAHLLQARMVRRLIPRETFEKHGPGRVIATTSNLKTAVSFQDGDVVYIIDNISERVAEVDMLAVWQDFRKELGKFLDSLGLELPTDEDDWREELFHQILTIAASTMGKRLDQYSRDQIRKGEQ